MNNDIVTRLQDLTTDLLYNPDCDDEGCGDCAWHRAVMAAVAEIERLRAAGDALAYAFRHTGGLDVAYDAPLRAWEEARRG